MIRSGDIDWAVQATPSKGELASAMHDMAALLGHDRPFSHEEFNVYWERLGRHEYMVSGL